MSQTIADGLQRIINAKTDIDGAIEDKGGIVTKGLENSATDIGTIPISPPPVLIDKTITENGTYLPEDEYEVITLTNQTSPVEIPDSNGDDAELSVKGNMQQTGTPTPDNPIQPQECGDLSDNLYDASNPNIYRGYYDITSNRLIGATTNAFIYIPLIQGKKYYIYGYKRYNTSTSVRWVTTSSEPSNDVLCIRTGTSKQTDVITITAETNENYFAIFLCGDTDYSAYGTVEDAIAANGANLAIDNGYKIPISSANTTTNIYLGEVQTTRKIKKLVLDGTEEWSFSYGSFRITLNGYLRERGWIPFCSHYKGIDFVSGGDGLKNGETAFLLSNSGNNYLYVCDTSTSTTADFQAYLAAQYAAGTPVTIWYVLAESTTGIVNEPLMKIGTYVDTLADISIPTTEGDNTITVDTTVPPSSIDVSYHKQLGAEGYSSVTANVPNTYVAGDEGKVVSSGALVAQTAMPDEITENGTVDTTFYNSVTVNVKSGGGGSSSNDVNFYDYDGTVVQSYSAEDFANLSELPANPTHDGLTSQGWNWSLSDAKAYVASYGKLNIGQMYITSDGKTRLYISLPEGRTSPILQLYLNANSELDIDWGDGSTHSTFTSTSAGYKSERHEYSTAGDYVIGITIVNGGFALQSSSSNVSSILWNGNDSTQSPDMAYSNAIKKIEIGDNVTSIGSYAFSNCSSLSSITIPDSITSIGDSAFSKCPSLSSVIIPDSVTSITNNTFYGCYSLSSITIPDSVTSIGSQTFSTCSSLSSITIPDGVTSIGSNDFNGCSSLSSITIPDGVTSIGASAFYNCSALSSITIPDGVTSIGQRAFQSCSSLSSITIPDSVTSIGSNVFYNCSSLSSITIPDNVTSIGTSAFSSCSSLSSITIPDRIISIGSSAFSGCSSLASITIPDNVTRINSQAFQNCSYISFIKFEPTTPPTVTNSNAWSNVSTSTKILVPTGTLETYKTATNYPNPSTYTYEEY